MQTKFIKTEDYLLLLETNTADKKVEIKKGNYIHSILYGIGQIIQDTGGKSTKNYRPLTAKFQNSEVQQEYGRDGIWQIGVIGEGVAKNNCKKIIAHLPLNNAPILEGVDLLPEINLEPKGFDEYQFTLEDMIEAFDKGVYSYKRSIDGSWSHSELARKELKEQFIQSLSTQQLPKDFNTHKEFKDLETGEWINILLPEKYEIGENVRLKTITNSQGQKVVQGEYKFE